jgi:hypothetical protein
LVDVTVSVDRVWQLALSLLDEVLSAYSGKDGEYVLLGNFHSAVRSWRSGGLDVLGDGGGLAGRGVAGPCGVDDQDRNGTVVKHVVADAAQQCGADGPAAT